MTIARMPGKNSHNVIRIDTHRLTAMEEDTSYPLETLRQGRDCKTPVSSFSMLAGKPDQDDVKAHNDRAKALRRMLASAIGAWLAFALLVYFARLATNGA